MLWKYSVRGGGPTQSIKMVHIWYTYRRNTSNVYHWFHNFRKWEGGGSDPLWKTSITKPLFFWRASLRPTYQPDFSLQTFQLKGVFLTKNFFLPKKFVYVIFFDPNIFLTQNFFLRKNFLYPKFFLTQKFLCKNMFGSKKIYIKIFCVNKVFA